MYHAQCRVSVCTVAEVQYRIRKCVQPPHNYNKWMHLLVLDLCNHLLSLPVLLPNCLMFPAHGKHLMCTPSSAPKICNCSHHAPQTYKDHTRVSQWKFEISATQDTEQAHVPKLYIYRTNQRFLCREMGSTRLSHYYSFQGVGTHFCDVPLSCTEYTTPSYGLLFLFISPAAGWSRWPVGYAPAPSLMRARRVLLVWIPTLQLSPTRLPGRKYLAV